MNAVATKRTDGLRSVQISQVVDEGLEAWCKRRDRIKRATVTRILEQFLASPEVVQDAFLGEITMGLESAYAEALEALAKHIRKPHPNGAGADRLKTRKAIRSADGGVRYED